ncbi:MAG: flagellar basal body-associated FliL family protein [Gemmatimonadales bacterium]|nr:flagellar basal body-associated FliL family protein [Gemmatimonadales bacterium]
MAAGEAPPPGPAPGDPGPSNVGGSRIRTVGLGVGSALLGMLLGGFVVGPKMAGNSTAAPKAEAEEKGHGAAAAERRLVRIENLVVNPAGSEGQRFLMVSVAFEVGNAAAETALKEAEVQVRDMVTGVFERQSMADLTRPGARDSLRSKLAEVVRPIAGGAPLRVYLPQFVIQ